MGGTKVLGVLNVSGAFVPSLEMTLQTGSRKKGHGRSVFMLAFLILESLGTSLQPVAAGQWIAEVNFVCEMKLTSGSQLTYPIIWPSAVSSVFTIACGKG
jgi:hypothetical protein